MSFSHGVSFLSMRAQCAGLSGAALVSPAGSPTGGRNADDNAPLDQGSAGRLVTARVNSSYGQGRRRDGAAPASSSGCASCAPAPVFLPPAGLPELSSDGLRSRLVYSFVRAGAAWAASLQPEGPDYACYY